MLNVINKISLGIITTLFLLSSCATKEQRVKNRMAKMLVSEDPIVKDQENVWKNNCSGYTFNYTDKFPEEMDTVTVYGKVRICSTGKTPYKTTISFFDKNGTLAKKIEVDKSGKYQVRLKEGHYDRIVAVAFGASIIIPSISLGEVGSSMNIDLKLLRQYILF